jgi:ABC-type transporter MlaC component
LRYTAVKSSIASALAAISLSLLLTVTAFGAQRIGPGESTIRGLIASMKSYAQAKTPAERAAAAAKVSRDLALGGLARESLGAQWRRLDRTERTRFASLFKRSVETLAYPRAAQALSKVRVKYLGESRKGAHRVVRTRVIRPEGGEIRVDYSLEERNRRWIVADVSLDGESLAKAVRARIQKALEQAGYPKLVSDLERQVERAASGGPENGATTTARESARKKLSDRSVTRPAR